MVMATDFEYCKRQLHFGDLPTIISHNSKMGLPYSEVI